MNVREVVVLRSQERLTRAGVAVSLTALACGLASVAFLVDPVVGAGAVAAVLTGGCLVARALLRTRVVAHRDGVRDHRAVRTVAVAWTDVAALSVGRPRGCWGGACVRLHLRGGDVVDLLGTRAYSIAPSAESLRDVVVALQRLERLHADAVLRPGAGRAVATGDGVRRRTDVADGGTRT